jgi:hypothetical protein
MYLTRNRVQKSYAGQTAGIAFADRLRLVRRLAERP